MGWHRLEGTQAMVTDAPAVKATGGVDGWAASQMALRDEWQARVSALRKLERVSRNLARLRNLAQRVRLPAGLTAEVVSNQPASFFLPEILFVKQSLILLFLLSWFQAVI